LNPSAEHRQDYLPRKLFLFTWRDAVWLAEPYFAIRICFDFDISLPSFLQICISSHAEMTIQLCELGLKLAQGSIRRKYVTITLLVHFDQEGQFHQASR
jgi:hypothetical protein